MKRIEDCAIGEEGWINRAVMKHAVQVDGKIISDWDEHRLTARQEANAASIQKAMHDDRWM
jgi:hypothetical protein